MIPHFKKLFEFYSNFFSNPVIIFFAKIQTVFK
jgi:hypothetical protein